MPMTHDAPSVRHFMDDMTTQIRKCDQGEGMLCSTLDEKINHYVEWCRNLRQTLNERAKKVFAGEIAFDPEVERIYKEAFRNLLQKAIPVAARGREKNREYFELKGLDPLHYYLADFGYLLENWVSPQLAVSPSPRANGSPVT
jgi:hypothetical protein